MDANTLFQTLGLGFASGEARLNRPQTTGDFIKTGGKSHCWCPVGTGTWKLENAAIGTQVKLIADGAAVIQSRAGVTVITLASGQVATLSAKTATTWVVDQVTTTGSATLQDLYTNATTAQGFIPIRLTDLREVATGAVGNTAAGGGVLSSNTTPTFTPLNGATDATQIVTWASSNNDVLMVTFPIPPDISYAVGSSVGISCVIKSGGTSNAVGFTVDYYFDGVGSAITATSGTNQTTTFATKTAYLDSTGLTDTRNGAPHNTVTILLTPVAHTTDTLVLKSLKFVYPKALLAS